jgi:hypothetical protein
MSLLTQAFKLPINSENYYFVKNPYVPLPTLTYQIRPPNPTDWTIVKPQPMTVGRCCDIKYGCKNAFAPSYMQYTPLGCCGH